MSHGHGQTRQDLGIGIGKLIALIIKSLIWELQNKFIHRIDWDLFVGQWPIRRTSAFVTFNVFSCGCHAYDNFRWLEIIQVPVIRMERREVKSISLNGRRMNLLNCTFTVLGHYFRRFFQLLICMSWLHNSYLGHWTPDRLLLEKNALHYRLTQIVVLEQLTLYRFSWTSLPDFTFYEWSCDDS